MITLVSTCQHKMHEREFVKPIQSIIEKKGLTTNTIHIKDINITDLKNTSAIIICGTALKDFEYNDHLTNLDFIPTSTAPVLGICSGMQILAQLYGASLQECQEIGMQELTIHDPKFQKCTQVYAMHNVAPTVPNEFTEVASSHNCAHIIHHNEKPHLGVLFHPEVRNEHVIEDFLTVHGL